jgi:hypothetical protein
MSEAKPKRKLGVKIQKATDVEVSTKQEDALTIAPSSAPANEAQSQPIRSFFSAPGPAAASGLASKAAPASVLASKAAPASGLASKAVAPAPLPAPAPFVATTATATATTTATPKTQSIDLTPFIETEFQLLGEAIQAEETKRSYKTPKPEAFVPQTSRGFSDFIRQTYSQFTLKAPPEEPDYDACMKLGASGADKAEMYQYQQFVRD